MSNYIDIDDPTVQTELSELVNASSDDCGREKRVSSSHVASPSPHSLCSSTFRARQVATMEGNLHETPTDIGRWAAQHIVNDLAAMYTSGISVEQLLPCIWSPRPGAQPGRLRFSQIDVLSPYCPWKNTFPSTSPTYELVKTWAKEVYPIFFDDRSEQQYVSVYAELINSSMKDGIQSDGDKSHETVNRIGFNKPNFCLSLTTTAYNRQVELPLVPSSILVSAPAVTKPRYLPGQPILTSEIPSRDFDETYRFTNGGARRQTANNWMEAVIQATVYLFECAEIYGSRATFIMVGSLFARIVIIDLDQRRVGIEVDEEWRLQNLDDVQICLGAFVMFKSQWESIMPWDLDAGKKNQDSKHDSERSVNGPALEQLWGYWYRLLRYLTFQPLTYPIRKIEWTYEQQDDIQKILRRNGYHVQRTETTPTATQESTSSPTSQLPPPIQPSTPPQDNHLGWGLNGFSALPNFQARSRRNSKSFMPPTIINWWMAHQTDSMQKATDHFEMIEAPILSSFLNESINVPEKEDDDELDNDEYARIYSRYSRKEFKDLQDDYMDKPDGFLISIPQAAYSLALTLDVEVLCLSTAVMDEIVDSLYPSDFSDA